MTNVTILGVFRTHAQKEHGSILEMNCNLTILALLLFRNYQCIYSKSGLNGAQYKDVK